MKETRSANEVSWRQHISLYLIKSNKSTKIKKTTGNPSFCRAQSSMHPHTNFHDQKYYTPLVHSTSYLSRVSAPFPVPLICTHLSKCHCLFCLHSEEKQKAKITSTSHSTRRCSQLRTLSPQFDFSPLLKATEQELLPGICSPPYVMLTSYSPGT